MKGQWALSPSCPRAITWPVLNGVAQIHPDRSDKQRGRDTATHRLICKAIQPRALPAGKARQGAARGRGFHLCSRRERERGEKCLFRFIKKYQFAILAVYLHSCSQHSSCSCLTQNNFLDMHFVSTGNSFQCRSSAEREAGDSGAVVAACVPARMGHPGTQPPPPGQGTFIFMPPQACWGQRESRSKGLQASDGAPQPGAA